MRASIVTALLLFSCSTSPTPGVTAPPAGDPPARYLALGDSYTIGQSVEPSERFPVQLAAALRAAGIEAGAPKIIARTGWTTSELFAAVEESGVRGPYDLITLLAGVNDQYRGRSVDDCRRDFTLLLQRAIYLSGGRPRNVIVVSIPDWGVTPFAQGRDRARIAREIDAFNAVSREVAVRAGVRYVEITAGSRRAASDPSLIAADGLHPSGRMYAEWVAAMLPDAREVLAGP